MNLIEKLRENAPEVAFEVTSELDPYKSWDGDGPSPREIGFSCYDVTVSAKAVVHGELVDGQSHLGGCWYKSHAEIAAEEVGGYLPQMLEEAAEELAKQVGAAKASELALNSVTAFLRGEMRRRYDEQRAVVAA